MKYHVSRGSTAFAEELEAQDLVFRTDRGRITEILAHPEESPHVLNIKRGILSALQVQFVNEHAVLEEVRDWFLPLYSVGGGGGIHGEDLDIFGIKGSPGVRALASGSLPGFFLRLLRFLRLLKNQLFQIAIRPGMVDRRTTMQVCYLSIDNYYHCYYFY